MAQSTEYPDLKWVSPKSWTNANRSSVQCVVIHMTEGAATASAAEDGAAYDQRRTDGTSTHYFHDSNTTIQCVRTEDQAHAARTQGNRRGIQHELCGRGGTIDWSGDYGTGVLERAAKQVARDCKKWNIPVRKISASQLADGVKGICGHVDVTDAFPQDDGTHTDPGSRFPWSRFIDMVQDELAPKEDDMNAAEMTAWANSDAGREALKQAAVAALETKLKYQLDRIAGRGWSTLSLSAKIDYVFESLVAAAQYDADGDGTATESGSVQSRLGRLETLVEQTLAAVSAGPTLQK